MFGLFLSDVEGDTLSLRITVPAKPNYMGPKQGPTKGGGMGFHLSLGFSLSTLNSA